MDANPSDRSPDQNLRERRHSSNLNRSCEGCRHRKVRCQPLVDSSSGTCVRCEKLNLSCVYLAPQVKRRRKRTDVRVAELEKELRSLRHRFDEKRDAGSNASPGSTDAARELTGSKEIISDFRTADSSNESANTPALTIGAAEDGSDDIEVDAPTAELLFTKFKMDLGPHLPFILSLEGMSAKQLKEIRPVLYTAILAASSESLYPPLGQNLFHKVEKLYAHHVLMEGEKSLELVQAMLITALWCHPPDRFSGLKFTTYAHLAANMALDTRLGNPKLTKKSPHLLSEEHVDDSHRTVVACYVACCTMGLALKRPLMLRWSNWVHRAVRLLEQNSRPRDRELAAWARLQQIAEEAVETLGFDDMDRFDLKDSKAQCMLRAFERQLDGWKLNYWEEISASLKMHFYYVKTSLHEVSLHLEYNHDEFDPPYLIRPKSLPSDMNIELSPAYVGSVIICCESAKAMLDQFLTLDTIALRSIYVIIYARAFYAIVVLTKIMICTKTPGSEIGKIVDPSIIKLNEYMQRVMSILHVAAGTEPFTIPATFLGIFTKLATWVHRQQVQPGKGQADDLLEPLRYLNMKTSEESASWSGNNVEVIIDDLARPTIAVDQASNTASVTTLQSSSQEAHSLYSAIPAGGSMAESDALYNLPSMPWLGAGYQGQGVADDGILSDLTGFGNEWDAALWDDSPMLMFVDENGMTSHSRLNAN